jgi:hypothetical protein
MIDIASVMATYLQTSGFGTVGTDIFINQAPDDTNCVWVERLGGNLNYYVPIEEAVVNIYSKNTQGKEAVEKLEDIKRFVHRMHSTETSQDFIYTMLVLGDIELISRDMEYASIYKLTLQVTHRDKQLIS